MTDAIIDELINIYSQDKRVLIPKGELMEILDKLRLVVNISGALESFGFDTKALAKMAREQKPVIDIKGLDTKGDKE